VDRRLLSGLPDETRKALENLGAAGWNGSKTGGGHIKLTHPMAPVPVFTASTPSCPRAMKNTTALCRRMLKQGAAQIDEGKMESPTSLIELPPEFSGKRRRKGKPRHTDHPPLKLVETSPMIEEDEIIMTTQIEAEAPKISQEERITTTTVETRPVEMPAAEVAKAADAPNREITPPKTRQRATQKPSLAPAGVDRVSIDARTLGLALEILQGRLPRLKITPDMVGQTMVWREGRFMLIDMPDIGETGEASPTPLPASLKAEDRISRGGEVSAQEGKRRDQLIQLLQTFPEDWMTVRDLHEMDESGIFGNSQKSQLANIRTSLQALVDGGEVLVQPRIGRGTADHASRYRIAV
jgi:hypothetical protein